MNCASPGPALWSNTLQICSYDVDVSRCATLQSLCRYFLEAAWNHAEALEVGFSDLITRDRVWVLSRLTVQVRRLPKWGEKVSLNTWPRANRSLFALRDFEFLDPSGALLAAGVSSWLILNVKTRRPQRPDSFLNFIQGTPDKRALPCDPEKLPAEEGALPVMQCAARLSDTDVNAHVNSARYLDWVLDSYPMEFHQHQVLEDLKVNYLGETRVGDCLVVYSRETKLGCYWHSIRKSGGIEVCRARLGWKTLGTTP